jgi:hypothetical protein
MDLKPVEASTVTIMTTNVALSPVEILTIANTVRIKLNGCAAAAYSRAIAFGARSVTKMLEPYFLNADCAASSVNPRGLEPGSRLRGS